MINKSKINNRCEGSGQPAQYVWSMPVCPVCHHTAKAGLPKRIKPQQRLIVPEHKTPPRK